MQDVVVPAAEETDIELIVTTRRKHILRCSVLEKKYSYKKKQFSHRRKYTIRWLSRTLRHISLIRSPEAGRVLFVMIIVILLVSKHVGPRETRKFVPVSYRGNEVLGRCGRGKTPSYRIERDTASRKAPVGSSGFEGDSVIDVTVVAGQSLGRSLSARRSWSS
jgi:hypothetical protein